MSVDFTAYADNIAENNGGTVDTADYNVEFARMVDATKTVPKTSARVTELQILAELGAITGSTIMEKIYADTTIMTGIMKRVIQGTGVDVADPQTIGMIDALVGQDVIALEEGNLLKGLVNETVPMFPGLKIGHVQNAIEYRKAGRY